MNVSFKDIEYDAVAWNPNVGRIGNTFAYDTETTVSDDPAIIPDFVIGTVFNGKTAYFIRRQDLAEFWKLHADCVVFFHTASFDLEATAKACGFNFHPMVEAGLIRDISIYYRLLQCATDGDVPHRFNLALMCRELLGLELEKDDAVRKDFGRFDREGMVDYAAIPADHLIYAARDAIATYQLAQKLEPECLSVHTRHTPLQKVGTAGMVGNSALWGWLGHDIQLRGDIALRAIERHGLRVDAAAVAELDRRLAAEIDTCKTALEIYGYVPGRPGNQAVFDRIISSIEADRGVTIPATEKSGKKSQAADALAPIDDHQFVAAFIRIKALEKLRKTYISHLQECGGRIHPRYTLLVKTGRTSCGGPNVQNLPRDGGVRECIVPAPGHVLIAPDYSMLELCTLAQIAYSLYGSSAMRDLINQGVDLHRHVASMVMGKPVGEISKADRQKAKAVSFGLPGGMGAGGLQRYARESYGVELTEEDAVQWRATWLNLFPEMRQYLTDGDDLQRLGATLDLAAYPDQYSGFTMETAAAIVLRVAGGAEGTSSGRSFSTAEKAWAWSQIANSRAAGIKSLASAIESQRGSRDLQRAVIPGRTVSIPTGRVRADCSYTESRNWPFQALAADGAKLALYDLIQAGYRVVAFVHDEALVELPESDDYSAVAADMSQIMIEAMRRVCPDVEIRTEFAVMRRWTKSAKAIYDELGRLIPYEDQPTAKHEKANNDMTEQPPAAA